jgi:hypothetical protein
MITLTDGSQIEYHTSFSFPRHVYMKFKPEDKETLRRERAAYNENQRQRSEIQELRRQRSEVQELRSQINVQNTDATTANSPLDHICASQRSQVSQMTSGPSSVMGGRNEQAQNRQNRRIAAVTTQRHVQSATMVNRRQFDTIPPNTSANNECDTNANTCCLGKNFVVLHATFRTADVYAYDTSIKPIENVPIVSAATAYDDPMTGDTFILVFNKALYYGSRLDHSLINPNQVWAFGIPSWDDPYDPDKGLSIDVDDSLHIPLQPVGTKLQFRTRVPTAQELATCEHVHMTSPSIWNPSDIVMIQETVQRCSISSPWKRQSFSVLSVASIGGQCEYLDATSDEALLDSIDPPSLVQVGTLLGRHDCRRTSQVDTVYEQTDLPSRRTFVSSERHVKASAEVIAERLGIGPGEDCTANVACNDTTRRKIDHTSS